MKRIFSILLLTVMVFGLAACNDEPTVLTTVPTTVAPTPIGPVYERDNYTVTLADVQAAYSTVAAELGDQKVDIELFQIAYWTEFVNFLYRNSNNLEPFKLDPSVPLHQQPNPGIGGNWQQYFINEALKTLHNRLAMVHAAQLEGIEMPADLQSAVDADLAEMEKAATEAGYTDMNAYITYLYGPGCTLKGLKAYNYLAICSDYYQNTCISRLNITDQMVDDYYEANKQDFINAGMIQDDRVMYRVRHIMVMVDDSTSDSEWEAAHTRAQKLLDQYLAGEQTEEAFAKLALDESDDGETYLGGGMIDGLVPESTYPQAFKDWYLADTRQTGDVELVKTELGYHIIYYIGTIPTWRYHATQSLTNTIVSAIVPDTVAKYPLTVHYDKLLVSEAGMEK